MKSPFLRSVVGTFLLLPLATAFTLSVWGQPDYFHLDPVGYCAWPTADAPLTASVQETHVFMIDDGGGLVSVAIGDPSHPTHLARWDSGGALMDLAIAGNRACLAAGDQGVHFVDIADPTRLTRVGAYVPGGFVFAVDGAGDRVYVAWQTRGPGDPQLAVQVDIVDIADAAQPRRLGLIALPYENGYGARDVHLAGEILYIGADALYGFNVSDAAHPVRTGMTILPIHSGASLAKLRIADGRAYALSHARFSGGLAIYATPSSIDSYYLFTFWPTQGNASDFWADGRYVFLADSPFSFGPPPPDCVTVLNAADPFHLLQVGQLALPRDAGNARFIRTLGDHVFVGTDLGLVILKTAKQPAFLRSSQVGNQLALVCNDVEGMRLERSWNLIDPVWQNLGAVNPDEVLLVSMERGLALFRLVKP
jgi:hypothetical protein